MKVQTSALYNSEANNPSLQSTPSIPPLPFSTSPLSPIPFRSRPPNTRSDSPRRYPQSLSSASGFPSPIQTTPGLPIPIAIGDGRNGNAGSLTNSEVPQSGLAFPVSFWITSRLLKMSEPDSDTQGESELFEWWNGFGNSSLSGDDAHITPFSLVYKGAETVTNGSAIWESVCNWPFGCGFTSASPSVPV
ncbi:hypothetical protein Lser_V15G32486 [Lactuca serriola]